MSSNRPKLKIQKAKVQPIRDTCYFDPKLKCDNCVGIDGKLCETYVRAEGDAGRYRCETYVKIYDILQQDPSLLYPEILTKLGEMGVQG